MTGYFAANSKRKYSSILRNIKGSELTLAEFIKLRRRLSQQKAMRRLEKRFGTYLDWSSAEKTLLGVTVPYKIHNRDIEGNLLLTSKIEDVPKAHREMLKGLFDK